MLEASILLISSNSSNKYFTFIWLFLQVSRINANQTLDIKFLI
jgi:hypothetical protein